MRDDHLSISILNAAAAAGAALHAHAAGSVGWLSCYRAASSLGAAVAGGAAAQQL